MSRADRPIPGRDCAPSTADSRRTGHGIQDSDDAPSARAINGYPLCLPLWPFPAARTRWPCVRRARAQNTAWIHLDAAVPSRPTSATREVAALLQPPGGPALADILRSSPSHLSVAPPAIRRTDAPP